MKTNLLHGDCLEVMKTLPDASIDSIVTDPPYGLSEHKPAEVAACLSAWLAGEEYTPKKKGFMGKSWDSWVPGPEVWRECYRVLKPGGHILAFAGSRTHDLMSMAMRLAGFECRDTVMWVYGSGFPKSLDVSKAIDKAAGEVREVLGVDPVRFARLKNQIGGSVSTGGQWEHAGRDVTITAPATPAAKQWQGWGTALKPAFEPCLMFRKPMIGTVAANVMAHGTGAINVDGCRVATDPSVDDPRLGGNGTWSSDKMAKNVYEGGYAGERVGSSSLGRFPANLIHDGSDEVLALFPDSAGSGGSVPNVKITGYGDGIGAGKSEYFGGERKKVECGKGSAARFFYCPKASKKDRDEGCDGFDVIIHSSQSSEGELWDQEECLARLHVGMDTSRLKVISACGALNKSATEWNTFLYGSGRMDTFRQDMTCTTKTVTSSTTESRILNCFQNLLTRESTAAARFGMESGGSHVESVEHGIQQITITSAKTESARGVGNAPLKARLRISVSARRNNHVTVKPTDLMQYLCRLVTPPGGTVLDPFMGSGSTGKAAVLEGFDFLGIEREAEYLEIAKARISAAESLP